MDLGGASQAVGAGFDQQGADGALLGPVFALAEVLQADLALGVDEVLGGPVFVLVGVPRAVFVVLGNRVVDAVLFDRRRHVGGGALEWELRRVDADDVKALGVVLGVPRVQVGQRADAVDARVGPEVHEDDVAAEAGQRDGLVAGGVEPVLGVLEFGCLSEIRECLAGVGFLDAGILAGLVLTQRSQLDLGGPMAALEALRGVDTRTTAGRPRWPSQSACRNCRPWRGR